MFVILQLMNNYLIPEDFTMIKKVAFAGGYLAITILLAYVLYKFYEKEQDVLFHWQIKNILIMDLLAEEVPFYKTIGNWK